MRLEIVEGDGAGGFIEVPPRGHFVLGRHPAADLKLKGKGVSRRHALLMVDGQERAVQDLGSQNGTYVNGTKIEGECALKEGDKIRIGASVLLRVSLSEDHEGDPFARLGAPNFPATRVRPRKKALLADLEIAARPRCAACDDAIAAEGLASRAGVARLDDGALICAKCAPGIASRELIAKRYRVLGHLGEGSVAVVLKAIDEDASRLVAIKLVKEKDVPKQAAEYMEREIEILRSLDHPSIVRLLDAGGARGGDRFFAMELVRGMDLRSLVEKNGPLASPDAALVGFSIAGALAYAHRRQVVHRDVKPSNVLLEPNGAVKLADFGVARMTTGGKGITRRGSRRGTPAYMAPEQARDPASAGPRADVYGIGATLYHALSGSPPYGDGTPPGVILEKLDKGEPPVAFNPTATMSSIGLSDVVARAMLLDPAKRFADAGEMRSALHEVLDLSAKLKIPT